jgi:predicted DNA-binding antitoxin AbrB/MazE fold protein
MEKVFQAVYQNGVLRPDEPLSLAEMQRVNVVITESLATDDDLAGYFAPETWAEAAHDRITRDDAREALSSISGSLSDAVTAQRQER